MRQPAEYAEEIEREPMLPAGSAERFSGYGVMGLPFRSGHILGLRCFSASSIGPGYRSVWHRGPSGRWTFYQDQPAELACTRYFGAAVDEVRECPIEIAWTGPRSFEVGLFGWMALAQYVIWKAPIDSSSHWFLMQIGMILGFVTSWPVNRWLLRHGIKEPMPIV
jgi:hypothetical protein